jgi:hypothetical protein
MSYPAPAYLEDDIWFGPAFRSEKAEKKLKVEKIIEKRMETIIVEETKEVPNIHTVMYEIATKNQSTTLHLDPAPVLGGGSEEVWQSGSGMNT